mgnify:CR=1 FL=1
MVARSAARFFRLNVAVGVGDPVIAPAVQATATPAATGVRTGADVITGADPDVADFPP